MVDKVQNRALRGFLGVGIYHPITALETESNWIPARWRVRMKVVLYWQKLLIRPDSVIVTRVINCILANNIKVEWVSKIVSIFDKFLLVLLLHLLFPLLLPLLPLLLLLFLLLLSSFMSFSPFSIRACIRTCMYVRLF